ncbi:MAG: Tsi3 family protein [Myxococcales bacterium]|nr:Tsi3 family protein [Myxococcales bacterium]
MTATVVRHSNGLSLLINDKQQAAETAAGFRITMRGSQERRNPEEVDVELRPGQPAEGFPKSRKAGGRTYHYRIDVESAGSSGDLHVLKAWADAGAGHVWIEQAGAAEGPGAPDFGLAWEVAGGARAQN